MRLLIVTNTYPPGDISGVGTLAFELATALAASGNEARVLTRSAPAGDRFAIATGGGKLLFPVRAAWTWLRQGERFDLVHVHESDGVVLVVLARILRALSMARGSSRLVATLQVSYRRERLAVRPIRDGDKVFSRPTRAERVFAWLRAPVLAGAGRITARLVDCVVAPSEATALELSEDYGARAVEVIANGVDPHLRRRAQATAGGVRFLYAGRLRTRKAVAVLLEAFARVRAELPGARLLLAGAGEQRPALERQASRLGIAADVEFAGALSPQAVRELFDSCDIFCLASTYEGFPLAILEAMAAAIPVVATRVAGIPEAIEDGETGILVAPENVSELAAAMLRLGRDPNLARSMGAAGRSRLEAKFGRAHIGRQHLELYARLVGEGR